MNRKKINPCVLTPQIRSSITTLLFSGREFSWTRHMLIAAAILAFNNMLVIFVPTIRDIFGFIGESGLTKCFDTQEIVCVKYQFLSKMYRAMSQTLT